MVCAHLKRISLYLYTSRSLLTFQLIGNIPIPFSRTLLYSSCPTYRSHSDPSVVVRELQGCTYRGRDMNVTRTADQPTTIIAKLIQFRTAYLLHLPMNCLCSYTLACPETGVLPNNIGTLLAVRTVGQKGVYSTRVNEERWESNSIRPQFVQREQFASKRQDRFCHGILTPKTVRNPQLWRFAHG